MSDSPEEHEALTQNQQIIKKLREAFHASELRRLNSEVEPATIFFFPVLNQEEVE